MKHMVNVFRTIRELLVLLMYSNRQYITPYSVLTTRPLYFRNGNQEDCYEYLGHLLIQLHEEERKYNNESLTLIERNFTGQTATVRKCFGCGNLSTTWESFNELQLTFPSPVKKEYSIQELLNIQLAPQILEGNNQYSCEKCDKQCDGEQKLSISSAPTNLILVIKSFVHDRVSEMSRKLTHKVHLEDTVSLNVTKEQAVQTQHMYRLNAAIVHSGSKISSGHYYTIASDDRYWFKFDDQATKRSSLEELNNLPRNDTPYVLFFELMDMMNLFVWRHSFNTQNSR